MRQSIIVATAALTLIACDRDTTGPAKANGRTMSARIDGAAWSAMSIAVDSTAPSLLVVTGTNPAHTLALVIPVEPGPGTQTVGSTTPIAAILMAGPQSWAASRTQGGSGSVTLTTVVTGRVAGTFEFTMGPKAGASPVAPQVTSGTFDVRY